MAVLGASNYTFAEATWSQGLSDWIGSHERAFSFFGGVPELLIPDNLKSGVLRVVFYSLQNTPLDGGTLGRVILQPPESAPPLEVPQFTNPLFADPSGNAFGLSTGFPALQILAPADFIMRICFLAK